MTGLIVQGYLQVQFSPIDGEEDFLMLQIRNLQQGNFFAKKVDYKQLAAILHKFIRSKSYDARTHNWALEEEIDNIIDDLLLYCVDADELFGYHDDPVF